MFNKLIISITLSALSMSTMNSAMQQSPANASPLAAVAYAAATTVNAQSKTQSEPKMRTCNKCGSNFADLAELLNHLKRNHTPTQELIDDDSSEVQPQTVVQNQKTSVRKTKRKAQEQLEQHASNADDSEDSDSNADDELPKKQKNVRKKINPNTKQQAPTRQESSDDEIPLSVLVRQKTKKENMKAQTASQKSATAAAAASDENATETDEESNDTTTSFHCNSGDCGKSFKNQSALTRHNKLRHKTQTSIEGEIPCSFAGCPKTFKQKQSMTRHALSHLPYEQWPHVCDFHINAGEPCNKRFTQKSHLDSHMRIHTGIKPFTCCVCDKSFTQQSTLASHEKIH